MEHLKHADCPVEALCFLEREEALVSVGGNGALRVWGAYTGELLGQHPAHTGSVRGLHCGRSADVVTGGTDHKVRVWHISGGAAACTVTLKGHTAAVNCVRFSPSDKLVASGGADNTIRLCKWASPALEASVIQNAHASSVSCLSFAPSG